MPPDQRSWKIWQPGRIAGKVPAQVVDGPPLRPGESVPVVEAVLAPETVEVVAKALAENRDSDWWQDALMEMESARLLGRVQVATCHRFMAREALRAAGFRVPGENEGGEDELLLDVKKAA